jgi:ribosomal protein S18 acetylase RimI-like enzyme
VIPTDVIRQLEGRALNALPALESERYGGWELRAAGGYTGRANSVAPLDPGHRSLDEMIAYTEAWYRSRNLPPMLRLTPASQPSDLDLFLQNRGYVVRDEGVSVQARSLDGAPSPSHPVDIVEGPVPESWLKTLASLQTRVTEHFGTVRKLFSRLPSTSAFASIHREGSPAAIGRAVFEGNDVGLFDVITRPDLRGNGLATAVTLALLDWGAEQGATRAYLQVETSNDPAQRLYRRLGFREVYRYWYRVATGGKWEV